MTTDLSTCVMIERKALVKALERIVKLIPQRSLKPVLQGVRIEASQGRLWLAATDLETSLLMHLGADGELARCVVPARELLNRVKASRAPFCELHGDKNVLVVNGGGVEHRLNTLPVAEFPLIPQRAEGQVICVSAGPFREALGTALAGVAETSTRYAIHGVLLEVADGVRLVATDGRRMVGVELRGDAGEAGSCQAILPPKLCKLVRQVVDKNDESTLNLYVKAAVDTQDPEPPELYLAGAGWLAHCRGAEGNFPMWRDIVPRGGSRFMVSRSELLGVLREIAPAGSGGRGVRLRLAGESSTVTYRGPETGESTGRVRTRFMGGGDSLIVTGFNAAFVIEALATLPGDQVVIEVQQNKPSTHDSVSHLPALLYDWPSRKVSWVIMPISLGLPANPESLGSNYKATA